MQFLNKYYNTKISSLFCEITAGTLCCGVSAHLSDHLPLVTMHHDAFFLDFFIFLACLQVCFHSHLLLMLLPSFF